VVPRHNCLAPQSFLSSQGSETNDFCTQEQQQTTSSSFIQNLMSGFPLFQMPGPELKNYSESEEVFFRTLDSEI